GAGGAVVDGDGDLPYGQPRRHLCAGRGHGQRPGDRGPLRTEMNDSLGLRPWMTAPATAAVLDALEAAGGPDCARFVGGCVRNAVLGQPISDIDIATVLPPAETSRALEAAGIKAIPTGVEHGTVTAVCNHKPFEVTTLRRDV